MLGSVHDPERFLATDHLIDDLGGRAMQGGAITVVAQAAKTVLQFGAIILLARLVTPDQFGLVAMVAALLASLELCRDLALSMATAQRPRITHVEVSTLFWLNIGICLVAAAAIIAIGPSLATFYQREEIDEIAVWLAAAVAIASLSTQHVAILRRQMRFAALAAVELGAAAVGFLTAVVVAILEGGFWALVAQRVAWSAALAVASWTLCGWRPGMPSRRVELRALLGFGGGMTLASTLNAIARTVDHVLIGWWAGPYALGLYERANKLLMAPIQNINAPLFAVALPALSRLAGSRERYRRGYLKALEAICMVTMPAAALLIVTPDWVLELLFGPVWADAAPIVMWLGVAALYQPASNTAGWLLITQDRIRDRVRWSVIRSVLRFLAIVAGLPYGAEGVAASLALSGLLLRAPLLFWMVGRTGPVGTWDLYGAIMPSALAAGAVVAALSGLRSVPELLSGEVFVDLVLAVALSAVVSILCYAGFPRGRRALRGFRTIKSAFLRVGARP